MIEGSNVSGTDCSPNGGTRHAEAKIHGAEQWARTKRSGTSRRSARRGVTLIEAVLFISIALGLVVGGLVFYQQATLAARTQEAARQFSALVQETRALYKTEAFEALVDATVNNICADGLDITAVLISAQAVPTDMIASPTELRNPWGGLTRVCGFSISMMMGGSFSFEPRMVIITEGVPREACTRLMTTDATDSQAASINTILRRFTASSIVSGGMNMSGVAASPNTELMFNVLSPRLAASACEYGVSNTLLYFGNVPGTVAKLSGNSRSVLMGFALY